MQMVLPVSYAVIEEEEMMYLEGGWSYNNFKKSMNNLSRKVGSRAFYFSFGSLTLSSTWSYAVATTKVGAKISAGMAKLGGLVGGVIGATIGWIVGIGSAAYAVKKLGDKVRFS